MTSDEHAGPEVAGAESSADPGNEDTLAAHRDGDRILDGLRQTLRSRLFGSEAPRVGRFALQRQLGAGGMGVVYLAHDDELDRSVAIKLLPHVDSDEARLRREARAMARLAHPNIATVYDVGTHEGAVFVAMEYVEGQTLRQWAATPRSPADVIAVYRQAAAGLHAAHVAGIVHRDFKPENAMIGTDGRVRVLDFGLAKAAGSVEVSRAAQGHFGDASSTATGTLLGTPRYMAPEQFSGQAVGPAADQFALAVALYEALWGVRPFAGDSIPELALNVTEACVRAPPSGPICEAMWPVLRRALAAGPDDRYASVEAFMTASHEAALALEPQPARRASARRHGWWVAVLVLAVAGVATAIAFTNAAPRDEAETAAFAAMLEAADDDARLEHARAFLAAYDGVGDPARRAVAHATVGRILWQRSCDAAWLDLCVRQRPAPEGPSCATPIHGGFERKERDEKLVPTAREHLRAAAALGNIEPPSDPVLDEAWRDAIGAARLRLADADLEAHIGTEVPKGLDFEEDGELSRSAFELYMDKMVEGGQTLSTAYAEIRGTTAPWEIAAAMRTGLLGEAFAESLAAHAPSDSLAPADREAYCDAIESNSIAPARAMARQAYAWCAQKANDTGQQELPEARHCAQRQTAAANAAE